jgi:translation initiation factor IF-1
MRARASNVRLCGLIPANADVSGPRLPHQEHELPRASTQAWTALCTSAALRISGELNLAKEELLELDGVVDEVLPDSKYRVTLENGVVVNAYASGRMRKNHIRIIAGDRVTLELSVYDLTKGRINFRHKDDRASGGQPRSAMRRR